MSDLNIFADCHHLNLSELQAQGTGQVPIAVELPNGALFDGRVEAIRVVRYGRFGNVLYSILNALLIARALSVKVIELPSLHMGGADFQPAQIGDIYFSTHEEGAVLQPTLVGMYFFPVGFERLVGDYGAEDINQMITRYLRPIYDAIVGRAGSLGRNAIAMHFRGGDIFGSDAHPGYVQPPAAFYLKAVDYAQRRFGVDTAHLVFEDYTNPAVSIVADGLRSRGLSITLQSASIQEDLVSLISAHHLVAPYGTFCEAAALLSPVLETFTSFRRLGTQKNMHFWTPTTIGKTLRGRGARTFVVDDPDVTFTPPDTWAQTSAQIDLIRSYPQERLRHLEILDQPSG